MQRWRPTAFRSSAVVRYGRPARSRASRTGRRAERPAHLNERSRIVRKLEEGTGDQKKPGRHHHQGCHRRIHKRLRTPATSVVAPWGKYRRLTSRIEEFAQRQRIEDITQLDPAQTHRFREERKLNTADRGKRTRTASRFLSLLPGERLDREAPGARDESPESEATSRALPFTEKEIAMMIAQAKRTTGIWRSCFLLLQHTGLTDDW